MLQKEQIYGVVIETLQEQKELILVCRKFGINLNYPELENDQKLHHLWGFTKTGLGLIGTTIIKTLLEEQIFHGVKEVKEFLKKERF